MEWKDRLVGRSEKSGWKVICKFKPQAPLDHQCHQQQRAFYLYPSANYDEVHSSIATSTARPKALSRGEATRISQKTRPHRSVHSAGLPQPTSNEIQRRTAHHQIEHRRFCPPRLHQIRTVLIPSRTESTPLRCLIHLSPKLLPRVLPHHALLLSLHSTSLPTPN